MSIGSIPIAVIYGDVAQSVERLTVNQMVGGSIPPISANNGDISLISKALDCDSSRYRCKSYISPQFK